MRPASGTTGQGVFRQCTAGKMKPLFRCARISYPKFLAVILLPAVLAFSPGCEEQKPVKSRREAAGDFGRRHPWRVYHPQAVHGNVVVLYFWKMSCCGDRLKQLEPYYSRNKHKGLTILAIDVGDAGAIVDAYVKKSGLTFTLQTDEHAMTSREYGVFGFPTIFILDRTGTFEKRSWVISTPSNWKNWRRNTYRTEPGAQRKGLYVTPVSSENHYLYCQASLLAYITIGYNLVEGLVSVWFGLGDETFALFGFGLDSFVEVISGIGIWHMVRRQRAAGGVEPDRFERRALQITGGSFYLLAGGLIATALVNIFQQHRPTSTLWGIIVALVSIVSMGLLIRAKVRVGAALASPAILSDAACTRACLYLSLVLLAASAGYELTGIGWFDAVGTLGIAGFSVKEGREAFRKARGIDCCCNSNIPECRK